jgi:DNA polymerase iota
MIDYNVDVLNRNDLSNSFFHLDKSDPTVGFSYDASLVAGPTYPVGSASGTTDSTQPSSSSSLLYLRLLLGSHLAQHLRLQLEEHHGYTATVGVSTSKLLSKLAGNVHKG